MKKTLALLLAVLMALLPVLGIAEEATEETAYNDRQHDGDTAHGRRALLGKMCLRSVLTDILPRPLA